MAFTLPPPSGSSDIKDSAWRDWFYKLGKIATQANSIAWGALTLPFAKTGEVLIGPPAAETGQVSFRRLERADLPPEAFLLPIWGGEEGETGPPGPPGMGSGTGTPGPAGPAGVAGTPGSPGQDGDEGLLLGVIGIPDSEFEARVLRVFGQDTMSPSGFTNSTAGVPTGSTLTWTDATRILTLAPTGVSFNVFVMGVKYSQPAPLSVTVPNVTGFYYIYFTSGGVFTISNVVWDLVAVAPVSVIYWNATLGKGLPFEERHGNTMDGATHLYLHTTRGAQYLSGGALANYNVAPAGPVDSDNTFSVTSSSIADEDLNHALTAVAAGGPYTVMERVGATGDWSWSSQSVPLITTGGSFAFNEFTGGVWTRTALTGNDFANIYVLASPSLVAAYQFTIIPGQTSYSTRAAAQAETFSSLSLDSLPSPEEVVFYQITFQRGNSYSTTGKVRIAAAPVELFQNTSNATSASINIHNNLSGLQGGTPGEYYHLTAAEYGLLQTRTPVFLPGQDGQDGELGFLITPTMSSSPSGSTAWILAFSAAHG